MKLKAVKCNYIVLGRSEETLAKRLNKENKNLYKTDIFCSSMNCKELCMKAYSMVQMFSQLKYVGVNMDDLLEIYMLYISGCT